MVQEYSQGFDGMHICISGDNKNILYVCVRAGEGFGRACVHVYI